MVGDAARLLTGWANGSEGSIPSRSVSRWRRFYWERIRRSEDEICGQIGYDKTSEATIRLYGCGRPIGQLWRADSSFWTLMVTGEPLPPGRTEGAGGILCLRCFDDLCNDRGEMRMWHAGDL